MTAHAVRLLKAAGALAVLVAVIVGVPGLLAALDLMPHGLPSLHDAAAVLTVQDDGRVVQIVLAAGAWICWLLFTASTVAEVVALTRDRPVRALPGLGVFQQPVAALLAAVAVGLTVAPAVVGASSSDVLDSRPPLPVAAAFESVPVLAGSAGGVLPAQTAPVITAEEGPRNTPPKSYEVRRRDTLWALAERHLGDPLRYPEIVRLNPADVGPDNEIVPGTVLVLPSDATGLAPADPREVTPASVATREVTVEQGDTLWGISEEVTGDGQSWRAAWEANRGRTEPGGAVFSDPDVIRPGWTLSVPEAEGEAAADAPAPRPTQSEPGPVPAPSPAPTPESTPSPAGPAVPGTASPRTSEPAAPRADPSPARAEAPAEADSGPSAIAFAGGGALLAGVSLVALLRYRRRQFRHRRPGRLISSTPPELLHVERALHSAGSADVTWLDQALRSLVQELASEEDSLLPDVIAVCMTDDVLTLVLTSPAPQAPKPWTVDEAGTRWSIRRGDPLSYDERKRAHFFAPFPTLASVGSTAGGEHWLLDLERVATMSVTGDVGRGLDLLRFLAAELAHNTWSEMLSVTAVGFGEELAEINPDRFSHTEDLDEPVAALTGQLESVTDAMRDADTDVLTGRLRDIAADEWAPHVLLIGPQLPERDPALAKLVTALGRQPSRSGVAVVLVSASDQTDGARWQLQIDDTGLLRIPALGLELRAQQLPAEEAAPLAQMLAMAAVTDDRAVPPAHGEQPWESYADSCGDLRDQVGDGEPAPRSVGPSTEMLDSVLPLPEHSYADVAATTEQDVRALAPVTDDAARGRVKDADPYLDHDLAQWNDPSSPRPKLTLLGPVQVRAQGSLPERNPRRPFYTEIVAYLATRPGGATSERYGTAIWPDEPDVVGKTKVRQSISVVRSWLGRDPVTGADYLPSGLTAAAGGRYRVEGILIDAELFRRLRVRGLARGADGVADLQAALDLVTGPPFDLPLLRQGAAGGYSWLIDENARLDHEYAAMIVDVAHIVATHFLGAGRPELAQAAAGVALKAGSHEDVPLLDLVAACDVQGNQAEANAYVARILANHDAEVEEDLPPRTADILFRRQRLGRRS